jgi:hypothetical protein
MDVSRSRFAWQPQDSHYSHLACFELRPALRIQTGRCATVQIRSYEVGAGCAMQEQQVPQSADSAANAPALRASGESGLTMEQAAAGRAKLPIAQAAALQPQEHTDGRIDGQPQRIPHWLQQAERFTWVIVCIYIGLLVSVAPWFPQFWDANPLFVHSPALLHFVTQGYVRGLVSGLGLLNLWIALRDAIQSARESGPE